MRNKKGFTVILFLVYLTFFSLVTMFFSHALFMIIFPTISSLQNSQSVISLHIASDLFVRDIQIMRNIEYKWQLITNHEIIWKGVNSLSIGWSFNGGYLERKEGMYNGTWKKFTKSIVARGLSQASFTIDQAYKGIECILTPINGSSKPITCYVSLKKGVFSGK